TPADPDATVRQDYEFADKQNSKEVWEEFLRKHPTGIHATAARRRLAQLVPPVVPATPPGPAPKPAVGVFPTAPRVTPLAPGAERELQPKDTFKECDTCPEMIVVPAGSFVMGSPESEVERESDESPQHRVTFAKQFAVGKFSVTFDQFAAFVEETGHNVG